MVLPAAGKFSASAFWSDLESQKVSWFTAVPTIHQILLKYPSKWTRSHSLRFVRSCSSPMAPAVMVALEQMYGVPCLEAYGMTENAHQISSNPLFGHRKPGSVGLPTGPEVQIRRLDGGCVDSGETGEVCIRGESVLKAYHNEPTATAVAFHGEWFRTGDLGWLDPTGYLFLAGRLKEQINRAGEKISPVEVDNVACGFQGILEAVSFGAPSYLYGEEVHIAVVTEDGQPLCNFEKHLKDNLAAFKVPTHIHWSACALPRTNTGKLQRRAVRDHFLSDS